MLTLPVTTANLAVFGVCGSVGTASGGVDGADVVGLPTGSFLTYVSPSSARAPIVDDRDLGVGLEIRALGDREVECLPGGR